MCVGGVVICVGSYLVSVEEVTLCACRKLCCEPAGSHFVTTVEANVTSRESIQNLREWKQSPDFIYCGSCLLLT